MTFTDLGGQQSSLTDHVVDPGDRDVPFLGQVGKELPVLHQVFERRLLRCGVVACGGIHPSSLTTDTAAWDTRTRGRLTGLSTRNTATLPNRYRLDSLP
ncbi:hypothetical protein CITRIK5_30607 [Citricoccus sp. K5]|nr:hypothetical protein CITRIK5_30607 [Citricoccus sp. K5]